MRKQVIFIIRLLMPLVLVVTAAHTVDMLPITRTWSRPRRQFVALLIIALSLYVIVPQRTLIRQSLDILRSLQLYDVLAAIVSLALTFPLAAATYHYLTRRRLVFKRTVMIALANMLTNRLLPAGAGSIATFFVYLRKRKHTVNQATSVVAVNNFMGIISHGFLLLLVLVLDHNLLSGLRVPTLQVVPTLLLLAVLSFAIIVVVRSSVRRQRIVTFCLSLSRDLLFYRRFPLRLTGAFVTSALLTVANVVALWYCTLAVHGNISLLAALAVFTVGIIAGTATPTPGGLGGAEAGLLAGLLSYHVTSQTALAAVLLYRLISYWLTLALGILAYIYVEKRGYLHRFEPID